MELDESLEIAEEAARQAGDHLKSIQSGNLEILSDSGRDIKLGADREAEKIILETLQANNWNRNATSQALGINRTTLYKKMKRLGLQDPRQSLGAWADA